MPGWPSKIFFQKNKAFLRWEMGTICDDKFPIIWTTESNKETQFHCMKIEHQKWTKNEANNKTVHLVRCFRTIHFGIEKNWLPNIGKMHEIPSILDRKWILDGFCCEWQQELNVPCPSFTVQCSVYIHVICNDKLTEWNNMKNNK